VKVTTGQYQVKQYSALQNSDDNGNINRAWENIRQNIKILPQGSLSYYEDKQHNPCFDEEHSK